MTVKIEGHGNERKGNITVFIDKKKKKLKHKRWRNVTAELSL